jgi:hypothetical protein
MMEFLFGGNFRMYGLDQPTGLRIKMTSVSGGAEENEEGRAYGF